MKCFAIFIIAVMAAGVVPGTLRAQTADEKAIKNLLNQQSEAWNQGNVDGYMNGYWRDDSLLFIGKSGPKYGYKNTLENYKRSYPNKTAMGQLEFDSLQLKRLSPQYYFVTGRWSLQRTVGNLQGYFTLLFKKIKNNWVIICDHSS